MMKKNFPKILAGCTAMVLMTGALLVPSMAVNASAISMGTGSQPSRCQISI